MHYYASISMLFFGFALLAAGGGLHFLAEDYHWRRLASVMNANRTIDPGNPPRIVTKKLKGGSVITLNEGGLAKYTPQPGFISFEHSDKQIRHDLRWLKRSAIASSLLGLVVMLTGIGGIVRFYWPL